VLGAVGDVATTEGCAALTASVDKLGELAVLINNVGIFHVENFENVSDETWMK
jgi:NAD(P)-dependent dehydrogenase (short-subunit alcohol dehydrogenase family)